MISTAASAVLVPAYLPATAATAQIADVSQASAAHRLTLPPLKVGRSRPLVVVVAENAGAETTDFTVPYGVLKDSGVADVRSLATGAGPVQLRMVARIIPDATLSEFDQAEPAGADIVIVPAQVKPKDPILTAWVRAQAAKGAVIVSVCEGARVLAHAGLLDGRRAASHWSSLEGLTKEYPRTTWVRDQRYVQDGPVISTTGVSASIPLSLALVEAIGGQAVAAHTAQRFGVSDWSAAHRTADFRLQKRDVVGALLTAAALWSHESVEFPLVDNIDEVALSLRGDAWSRTFRSKVVLTSEGASPIRSLHGLKILPDARHKPNHYILAPRGGPAVQQLDASLSDMHRRYGPAAVRLAKLGMEYEGKSVAP